MDFTLRNMYTIIMNWGWLRGCDNGDFEDGDNADNFMGPLGILLYQMRYSGRCSVFYIELLLEDIDCEGGQNSNHIVVGFPTSGWVSNQWLEIHPWWVNFQPFTLVGLDVVVVGQTMKKETKTKTKKLRYQGLFFRWWPALTFRCSLINVQSHDYAAMLYQLK